MRRTRLLVIPLRFLAFVCVLCTASGRIVRPRAVLQHEAAAVVEQRATVRAHAAAAEDAIKKGPFDDRSYKFAKLDNGLNVLLVSDSKSNKAAAAMTVQCGSFDDPRDGAQPLFGLAHFNEHMLFLGTKKYPNEDDYSGFLAANGGACTVHFQHVSPLIDFSPGSDNAETGSDQTTFYFDVQPSALGGALDRFAGFFVSPLFSSSAVSREVNAVDAEHRKNLQDDGWRANQMLSEVAAEGHEFHGFGTGSLASLGPGAGVSAAELRAALVEYWTAQYTAGNMYLCVVGRESLDDLLQMVKKSFADVRNTPSMLMAFSCDATHHIACVRAEPAAAPKASFEGVYSSKTQGSQVSFKPVKDSHSLVLAWSFPPHRSGAGWYKSKSFEYICSLFNSQAAGSANAVLVNAGPALLCRCGRKSSCSAWCVSLVRRLGDLGPGRIRRRG